MMNDIVPSDGPLTAELKTRLEAYQAGKLSVEECIPLFQHLITSRLVCQMSDEYQRRARSYLEVGHLYASIHSALCDLASPR